MKSDFLSVVFRVLTKLRNPMVTNEHFVPRRGLDLQPYLERKEKTPVHHLVRYVWARQVIAEAGPVQNILDVACGSGYGSFMLASAFPGTRVVGADYDPAALKTANNSYHLPNLEFKFGDLLHWEQSLGKTVFDVITSFDTLEHVEHREIMMSSLVRHLAPTGQLLLSTPSGHEQPILTPRWPFHKIEYSPDTLYDFLRRYFQEVIHPADPAFPHREVFERVQEHVVYSNLMNPVVCRKPLVLDHPERF